MNLYNGDTMKVSKEAQNLMKLVGAGLVAYGIYKAISTGSVRKGYEAAEDVIETTAKVVTEPVKNFGQRMLEAKKKAKERRMTKKEHDETFKEDTWELS